MMSEDNTEDESVLEIVTVDNTEQASENYAATSSSSISTPINSLTYPFSPSAASAGYFTSSYKRT